MFDLSFACCDDNGRGWLDDDEEEEDDIRKLSNGREESGLLWCGDFDERSEGDVERATLLANDGNGKDSGVFVAFFSFAARRLS
jgi:hypothetical protein